MPYWLQAVLWTLLWLSLGLGVRIFINARGGHQ